MKPILPSSLIDFELWVMDFAEAHEVKSNDDLERLSATLHEHLENALLDYVMDEGIEDYEPQF